jgi:DNA primase
MNRQALDELKQQIPLMGYLQAHDWTPARPLNGGRWMGLCPLHEDHKPSFLVDTNKDLFYCYGCGRGGDVIRFAELYHQVKFPEALALLRQWRGVEHSLLYEAERFYRVQLHRHITARRLPICTNVESVPARRSNSCGSATHPAVACEVG